MYSYLKLTYLDFLDDRSTISYRFFLLFFKWENDFGIQECNLELKFCNYAQLFDQMQYFVWTDWAPFLYIAYQDSFEKFAPSISSKKTNMGEVLAPGSYIVWSWRREAIINIFFVRSLR